MICVKKKREIKFEERRLSFVFNTVGFINLAFILIMNLFFAIKREDPRKEYFFKVCCYFLIGCTMLKYFSTNNKKFNLIIC